MMIHYARRRAYVTGCLLSLLIVAPKAVAALDCIVCHNPSMVPAPHNPQCGDATCLESCHAINLDLLKHMTGDGTPIVEDRTATCNNCHNVPFAGVYHPYRINVDPAAPTGPGVIDLDQACGRCHGGSTGNPPVAGAPLITKAELAKVAEGMHEHAGVAHEASFTYTASSPNTLDLHVKAVINCDGSCPDLAYAWDWGDGTTTPASQPGPVFNTDPTASHIYATAGLKTIGLTIYLAQDIPYNNVVGRVARSIRLAPPDLPPTAAGTCTWNADTWTMTVVDASTDDGPDGDLLPGDGETRTQVVLDWGDGSARSLGAVNGTLTHVYGRVGSWTVTHRAIDQKLQAAERSCGAVTPAYFTIGGTVVQSDGTTPIRSATVIVRDGRVTKRDYTTSQGRFSVGGLTPGVYEIIVSKTGHVFHVPASSVRVGPSSTNRTVRAISP